MERRTAVSTDNLTIIPDVKPISHPLMNGSPNAPPYKDETVSEPDRNEMFSVNSFARHQSMDLNKSNVRKMHNIETDGLGRPVRPAIAPPIFDDRQESPTIEEYIFRFERCAKANLWRDSDKVDQIYHYLRGNAEKCYEDVLRSNPSIKWPELKNVFEERFTKRFGRGVALERMLQREQGYQESFRNYFYDKMALIRQIDNEMKIEDKLMYIMRGTKEDIRRDVRRHFYDKKIENDDELYSIVFEIDDFDDNRSYKKTDSEYKDRKADMRLEKVERLIKKLSDQVYVNRNRESYYNNNYGNAKTRYEPNYSNKQEQEGIKPKVRLERSEDGRPICDYCNKVGHTQHNCYKKRNDLSNKTSKN